MPQYAVLVELSAEPLVGLKRTVTLFLDVGCRLSAEPLVGLKPDTGLDHFYWSQAFSRTPRGFEAPRARSMRSSRDLSAEPLVGLKPDLSVLEGYCGWPFQPNPSWV